MKKLNVLFVDPGTACCGPMAVAWVRYLADRLSELAGFDIAVSATGYTSEQVSQCVVDVMSEAGVSLESSAGVVEFDPDWVIVLGSGHGRSGNGSARWEIILECGRSGGR